MPAGLRPKDWVEADVQFQDPSMQTSQSQLQLVGPSALSSQQPATGELAANLLAYANQLQQLPAQLPGDVHEEIADKLLEYADQLRQARHRSLLPRPSVQRRSNLPMSIRPQQQVPESSTYIGLSQHAESLPSTSGHHLPQRLQSQAAQQLLTQAAWSGEQLESQTGQLPHLAQQLQASTSQQPPQQLPRLAQHLPQQPEQLVQQLPPPAQQLQAITAPWPRRQRMEQALQPVAHDDFGLGTDTVAQAAAHPLSAPFAELITSPLHHLRPPPALQDVRGEWAYIHKPGVGTMPIAPPSASPAKKLAAAQASQQLRYGSSATVQVHQGLPVYSATAGAAAGASDSVAQALTGQFDAAQPKKKRPFPELKTFQSIEQLYKTAMHGDALSNTSSFDEMQKADPNWRKHMRQRFHEFNGILKEIELQAAERQVPPETVATAMDQDRNNKKQPVAKYVKEVGKLRAKRNKGTSAYHTQKKTPCYMMHYA